jgi:hypothetical protein
MSRLCKTACRHRARDPRRRLKLRQIECLECTRRVLSERQAINCSWLRQMASHPLYGVL